MPRDMEYGYYLVAFLDILGQREKLRQLRFPTNPQETKETIQILKETAGYVLALRRNFTQFFEEASKPIGILDSLLAANPQLAEQMRHVVAEHRGFSDSVIITVPLRNDDDHCLSMNGVYASLIASCAMLTMTLAMKRPLRGGIDVGLGLRLTENEIYGPALERAYLLESGCAEYPRVLIGNELWDYLMQVEAQVATTPFARIAKEFARDCKSLITIDDTGLYMLDFLGERIQAVTSAINTDQVKSAYEFVVQEQERLKDNKKLFSRYACLKSYFDSRLSLWGLKSE